ncbi:unnamed protein product [Urochloa humidicola]
MGRSVLVNSVLDSQLIYLMCAIPLSAGTLSQVDRRRRAFLWSGDDKVTGAQCLVAWEQVCADKDQGGLGIKVLELQNACLMLKLLHRLHHHASSSWAMWVRQHACIAHMEGDIQGPHWTALRELLPLYRAITSVQLGDGCTTSLWFDAWHGEDSLAEKFPALLSHCRRTNLTVHDAVANGVGSSLVPCLTPQAQGELVQLNYILGDTELQAMADQRSSPFADENGKLHTAALYKLLRSTGGTADVASVWKSCAPPRVQFFGWLLTRDRIQSRSQFFKRHAVSESLCEVCGQAEEIASHIMFRCQYAQDLWARLGVTLPASVSSTNLGAISRPDHIPAAHFDAFLLLCCWQLWKRWNGVVFRQEETTARELLMRAREEARLWGCRMSTATRLVSDAWCHVFSSAM